VDDFITQTDASAFLQGWAVSIAAADDSSFSEYFSQLRTKELPAQYAGNKYFN